MRAKRAARQPLHMLYFTRGSISPTGLSSILSLPTCIVSVNKLILDHKVTPTHGISNIFIGVCSWQQRSCYNEATFYLIINVFEVSNIMHRRKVYLLIKLFTFSRNVPLINL